MKLFKVSRVGWGEYDYDQYTQFIIAAKDEREARYHASISCAGEGPEVWLDPKHTTCTQIVVKNIAAPTIISSEFNAG